MTFLIAEPPLRRAVQQRCQGDPAHRNAPARNLHRRRGHQGDPGSSWLPTSRIGGWNSPGDSQTAESRAGGSGHLDGYRRRRDEVLRPDPGALLASRGPDDGVHRHSAPRHQACQRWQPVKSASSRPRARGRTKGESTARRCSYGLSQAAVHSRATGSGCSIQPDLQDGRIRPWDDSRSPPRCSSRSAFGLCLGRSG